MIALMVGLILAIFCIAPVEMQYRYSALICTGDKEAMILFPLCLVALLAVQFLKMAENKRLAWTFICWFFSFQMFLAEINSMYRFGEVSFERIMFETGGGILLQSIGFAGLSAVLLARKKSYRDVSRGVTLFLTLMALLSFLYVPFIELGTGKQILQISSDYSQDGIIWPYGFVFFPLLVAGLQFVRSDRRRFHATFALWIPFLLYFLLADGDDEFWGGGNLAFESALYACIAALTSVAAHYSMQSEPADRAEQAPKRAKAAADTPRVYVLSAATVLITAAAMTLSLISGDWSILFAAVLIGCVIANRKRLRIISLVGLGLSAVAWLLGPEMQTCWDLFWDLFDDYELAQLLPVMEYCVLALHVAASLLFIWTTKASRRVKILYSLLPVFMLTGTIVWQIIWSLVSGADAEAGQLAFEDRLEIARSYYSICKYVLFTFGAVVCALLWWMLRAERKR